MKSLISQFTQTKNRIIDKFASNANLENLKNKTEEDKPLFNSGLEPGKIKEDSKFSATLQFFAIYQKDKPILVLPCFYNDRFMTYDELGRSTLFDALGGRIMIPSTPHPWSDITEEADTFFLTLQSRKDWGKECKRETNLLQIDSVLRVLLTMQESLNNLTFRKDLLAGRFASSITDLKTFKVNKKNPATSPEAEKKKETKDPGMVPGQNWNV